MHHIGPSSTNYSSSIAAVSSRAHRIVPQDQLLEHSSMNKDLETSDLMAVPGQATHRHGNGSSEEKHAQGKRPEIMRPSRRHAAVERKSDMFSALESSQGAAHGPDVRNGPELSSYQNPDAAIQDIPEGYEEDTTLARFARLTNGRDLQKLLPSLWTEAQDRGKVSYNSGSYSSATSDFGLPTKASSLGKACAILGFEGNTGQIKPDKAKTKNGQMDTTRGSSRQRSNQAGLQSPNRTLSQGAKKRNASARAVKRPKHPSTRRIPVNNGIPTLRFIPAPRMKAPHPTQFFTENPYSEQDCVDNGNEMNGNASSEGSQHAEGDPSSSRSYDNTSNNGKDPPIGNTPNNEQRPPPSDNDMTETSDPEYPSEREQGSESEDELDDESDAEEKREEHIPLSYQIPPQLLHTAMQASPNTRASYWSQKLYRGPNNELLSTHYCRTMEVAERVAKYFLEERVLGFDIEWKPWAFPGSIKENASLIQVACEDRVALFHIALYPGRTAQQIVPPTLKAILESPNIYKVGVAVKADFSRLEKYLDIHARGVLELSRLYNLVESEATDPTKVSFKLVSLARQVQQHLLLPLYKGGRFVDDPQDKDMENVRESDWSRALGNEQIQYAAADAYAGFRLFDILESKRKMLRPVPPLPRLCDDDPKPEERTKSNKRKPKPGKEQKQDPAKATAKAIVEAQVEEEEEEDTQEYVTAAEDLSEDEELEESEESSEDSRLNDDMFEEDVEGFAPSSPTHTRQISRVDLSRLRGGDPGYPTLPGISSEEESYSDDSNAFDPLHKVLKSGAAGGTASGKPSPYGKAESDDEEYADPDLEEALMAMDIDTKPGDAAETDMATTNELQGETQELPPLSETGNEVSKSDAMDLGPYTEGKAEEEKKKIEPADTASASSSSRRPCSLPPPTFTPLVPDTTSHTREHELASTWAQSYLDSTIPSASAFPSRPSRIRATISHLRAYHLWHHQQIPLDIIGAHLRDPPLAQSTVSSYILQAINLERLEYRDEILRRLLMTLPVGLRNGRWRWLSRRVGIVR